MEELLKKISDLVEQGLGIDGGQILIQFISILVLYLVVKKFLWGPITEIIENRRAYIASQIKDAEDLKEEALSIKNEYDNQIKNAKEESRSIIEKASKEAKLEASQIIDKAKEQALNETVKAREIIEKEKEIAKKELKDETLEIAFLVASKIVEKEVNKKDHQEVVDEFLNGVDQIAS